MNAHCDDCGYDMNQGTCDYCARGVTIAKKERLIEAGLHVIAEQKTTIETLQREVSGLVRRLDEAERRTPR